MEALAQVLPALTSLMSLDLSENSRREDGGAALRRNAIGKGNFEVKFTLWDDELIVTLYID